LALDFQYDITRDGRQLRFLSIVDEVTRETFAIRAARSSTADATVAVLEEVIWPTLATRSARAPRPADGHPTSGWTTAPS